MNPKDKRIKRGEKVKTGYSIKLKGLKNIYTVCQNCNTLLTGSYMCAKCIEEEINERK